MVLIDFCVFFVCVCVWGGGQHSNLQKMLNLTHKHFFLTDIVLLSGSHPKVPLSHSNSETAM